MKGFLVAVIYSVFLVVLFCIMCFLMSTVNPLPIAKMNYSETTPVGILRNMDYYDFFKNIKYPRNSANLRYGLEKVPMDDYENEVSTLITSTGLDTLKELTIYDVSSPKPQHVLISKHKTWSFDTPKTSIDNNDTIVIETFNVTNDIAQVITNLTSSTNKTIPNKDRRSINENLIRKIDVESGGVILKIIGDTGKPRIEIKVGAKGLERIHEGDNIDKHTVIKITPNDTFVFDNIEEEVNKFNGDVLEDVSAKNISTFDSRLLRNVDTNTRYQFMDSLLTNLNNTFQNDNNTNMKDISASETELDALKLAHKINFNVTEAILK